MIQHIRSFWFVLDSSRGNVLRIVALFVLASLMDVVGVSLIGPYVAAVLEPDRLMQYPRVLGAVGFLGRIMGVEPLVALGAGLITLFLSKGFVAYQIHHQVLRFAFDFRARLIERLMRAYLSMPFSFYLSRSSASLVQSVTNQTKVLTDDLLIPSLRFISDVLVLFLISILLFYLNAKVMTSLAFVFGVAFFSYLKLVRPKMRSAGELVAVAHEGVIASVAQGIQGIKEIRVLGAEPSFLDDIRSAAKQNSMSQTAFNSMLMMPRYLMETTVVIFILGMTMVATSSGAGPTELFSLLAMLAAAGLRALPAMTQISASLASMNYSAFALREISRDLRQAEAVVESGQGVSNNVETAAATDFETISVSDLSFYYPGSERPAVEGVSLEIRRGTTVGFIGESGSGKTTLVDIIVGLHLPASGRVVVDGVGLNEYGIERWMRRIAYIPQVPFIVDDTVARNIALGAGDGVVDLGRLNKCIEQAQLSNVVANLPKGVDTILGGHGCRLSGGERQRIALARALYQERDVLVFDEATSALDVGTEREVVKTIEALRGSKTMLVIAHRFSTVRGCSVVYKLSGGRLIGSGALSELVSDEL